MTIVDTQLRICEIHRAVAFHATARANDRSKFAGFTPVAITLSGQTLLRLTNHNPIIACENHASWALDVFNSKLKRTPGEFLTN